MAKQLLGVLSGYEISEDVVQYFEWGIHVDVMLVISTMSCATMDDGLFFFLPQARRNGHRGCAICTSWVQLKKEVRIDEHLKIKLCHFTIANEFKPLMSFECHQHFFSYNVLGEA